MTIDLWKALPYVVPLVTIIGAGAVMQYQLGELQKDLEKAEDRIQIMSGKDTEILVAIEGVRSDVRHLLSRGYDD